MASAILSCSKHLMSERGKERLWSESNERNGKSHLARDEMRGHVKSTPSGRE